MSAELADETSAVNNTTNTIGRSVCVIIVFRRKKKKLENLDDCQYFYLTINYLSTLKAGCIAFQFRL